MGFSRKYLLWEVGGLKSHQGYSSQEESVHIWILYNIVTGKVNPRIHKSWSKTKLSEGHSFLKGRAQLATGAEREGGKNKLFSHNMD